MIDETKLAAHIKTMQGVLHLAKEMTRPGYHANPYHGLEHTHFDLHAAIDKALSTDCGKDLLAQHEAKVKELEENITWLTTSTEPGSLPYWQHQHDEMALKFAKSVIDREAWCKALEEIDANEHFIRDDFGQLQRRFQKVHNIARQALKEQHGH